MHLFLRFCIRVRWKNFIPILLSLKMKRLPTILQRLIKIFFWGLLLQFFLQTFVTYQLWWADGLWNVVWLWKEIFILIFLGAIGFGYYHVVKHEWWKLTWASIRSTEVFRFLIYFFVACFLTFLLAVGIQKIGLWTYILSFKYDLLGFLIFLLWVGLMWMFPLEHLKFHKRYQNILKFVIWGGLFRWGLIFLMPNALKFFGYSPVNFEGSLGTKPPAVYYTQINQGLVRNQFLFERPLGLWFFLTAFWPLFALSYLRLRSRKEQIWWTIGFGALVFSTLSRAALGVRLLQTAILALLIYRRQAKKLILYVWFPSFLILLVGLRQFRGIFMREHSNTGHTVLFEEGIKIWMQNPFFWWGAGYSGPASHQLCFRSEENARCDTIKEVNTKYEIKTYGYNPENQYVQIFMEYWIVGLLPWLFCFGRLIWIGLKATKPLILEIKKGKKADQKKLNQLALLVAFWLGMFGLALEGLVLHSFVDRMIVYPFMLLYGLSYGAVAKEHSDK